MLRRVLVETTVIFALLFVCVLYGAVSVRDVQTGTDRQPVPEIVVPDQTTPASEPESDQTAAAPVAEPQKTDQTGQSFSDSISRFFLTAVHFIARLVEEAIHLFF